jgi:hypothetical protein
MLMANLLIEAHHTVVPGDPTADPAVPPTPPNYAEAQAAMVQYQNQIAQQNSLLPSPAGPFTLGYTGSIPGLGADSVIFDRTNQIFWGYQNRVNAHGTNDPLNMPWIGNLYNTPGFFPMMRLPAMAELRSLGTANSSANRNAYNMLMNVAPGTSSSPTNQEYLNACGFDLAMQSVGNVGVPLVSLEALNQSNWTESTLTPDGGGGTYYTYSCPNFYDLVNGQDVTVKITLTEDTDGLSNVFNGTNVFSVEYDYPTEGLFGANGGHGFFYLDAIFVYRSSSSDPIVEEPSLTQMSATNNADGSVQCKCIGVYPERIAFYPFNDFVYWTVSDDTVASVSNAPGSQGLLTWAPSTPAGTNVSITASRGAFSAGITVSAAIDIPDHSTIGANLYPRGISLSGQAPFNSQVWVQRLYSDATALADDTVHFKLSSDSSYLKFTDTTGNKGTFTINDTIPDGTTTITITAVDTSGALDASGNPYSDSMQITVINSPAA